MVTLTGTLLHPVNQTPIQGHIDFRPTSGFADTSANNLYPSFSQRVELDSAGHFSVQLVAVDSPTLTVQNWAYAATVTASDGSIWKTKFQVFAAQGTVDWADILPATDSPDFVSFASVTVLVDETNARITADNTLVQSVVDEATARINADNVLAGAIGGKQNAGTALLIANNLSELLSVVTARTNLGLGSVATRDTGTGSNQVPLLSTGGQLTLSGQLILPVAGLTIFDANLVRSATNSLRTDGSLTINGQVAGNVQQIIKGAASQSVDLSQWQDSTGAVLSKVDKFGQLATVSLVITTGGSVQETGNGPYLNLTSTGMVVFNRTAVANIPFQVKGMASQSGDLQRWVDSAGSVLAKVAANGSITTVGTLYASIGTQTSDYSYERSFTCNFGGGAANEKIDIFWTGTAFANMEATLTGIFNGSNASGHIKAMFGASGSNTGTVWDNSNQVISASGNLSTHFGFLGPTWDATNSRWKLTIVHRTSSVNNVVVHLKVYGNTPAYLVSIRDSLGISAVYTTDATAAPAPTTMDRQAFTTSGTWVNPSPNIPRPVYVRGTTAGSGGGSGRRGAAGTLRTGGGGGAAGVPFEMWLLSTDLSVTQSVTVGSGGAGGASVTTDDTDGNPGITGGSSQFGSSVNTFRAGQSNSSQSGGRGGTAIGSAAGGASNAGGPAGGASSATGGAGTIGFGSGMSNGLTLGASAGGGAGGGITTGDAVSAGGTGGTVAGFAAGGNAGTASGGAGGAGLSATAASYAQGGSGGGGGGSNIAGAGGAGGTGGTWGAGGGGGGASLNGSNSGAGGAGADGHVMVITFL